MAEPQDAPINCIQVMMTGPDGNGNYVGTWTPPTPTGSFSNPVGCDVDGPGVPPNLSNPTASAPGFSFGNYNYNQPSCAPSDPAHPTHWTAFAFDISPTTWDSDTIIIISMTAQ